MRTAPPCLQKSDDVCSQYRKWLSAVSECTKALTASKTRLEEAKKDMAEREEDLNILVNEAGTFMQKEQARAAKRAKRHAQRCAGPCVPARQAAMLTWGLGQGLSSDAQVERPCCANRCCSLRCCVSCTLSGAACCSGRSRVDHSVVQG